MRILHRVMIPMNTFVAKVGLGLISLAAIATLDAECDYVAAGQRSAGTVVSMQGAWVLRVPSGKGDKDLLLGQYCALPFGGLVLSASPAAQDRSISIASPTFDSTRDRYVECKAGKPTDQCRLILPQDDPAVFSSLVSVVLRTAGQLPLQIKQAAIKLAGSPPDTIVVLKEDGTFDTSWFLQQAQEGDYRIAFSQVLNSSVALVSVSLHWKDSKAEMTGVALSPGLYNVSLSGGSSAWMLLAPANKVKQLQDEQTNLLKREWPEASDFDKQTVNRAYMAYAAEQLGK